MPSLDVLRSVANSVNESEVGAFLPEFLPLFFQPPVLDRVIGDDARQEGTAHAGWLALELINRGLNNVLKETMRIH